MPLIATPYHSRLSEFSCHYSADDYCCGVLHLGAFDIGRKNSRDFTRYDVKSNMDESAVLARDLALQVFREHNVAHIALFDNNTGSMYEFVYEGFVYWKNNGPIDDGDGSSIHVTILPQVVNLRTGNVLYGVILSRDS